MKEFMLVFRRPNLDYGDTSPKEMEDRVKKWQEWVGIIAAQNKLAQTGTRLANEGKVLKPGGVITDGPFVEIREILGGAMVIKAANLDEATTLAHGCPVLDDNGSVEIRPVYVDCEA